jgi:hypothetical protein
MVQDDEPPVAKVVAQAPSVWTSDRNRRQSQLSVVALPRNHLYRTAIRLPRQALRLGGELHYVRDLSPISSTAMQEQQEVLPPAKASLHGPNGQG